MNGMPLEILIKMYKSEYGQMYNFLPKRNIRPKGSIEFSGIIDTPRGNFFVFIDSDADFWWFSTDKSFEEHGLEKVT